MGPMQPVPLQQPATYHAMPYQVDEAPFRARALSDLYLSQGMGQQPPQAHQTLQMRGKTHFTG